MTLVSYNDGSDFIRKTMENFPAVLVATLLAVGGLSLLLVAHFDPVQLIEGVVRMYKQSLYIGFSLITLGVAWMLFKGVYDWPHRWTLWAAALLIVLGVAIAYHGMNGLLMRACA